MVRFSRLAFAALIAFAVVAVFQHSAGAQGKATKPAAKPSAASQDSLARLEAAVKKDSTNARATYRLGIAYLDRDRPGEAAHMFTLATQSKPDYVEAWVNLGAAQDANGHGGEARHAYRTALGIRKDDEIAMCRLASSYYAVGMRDSAMETLREQIKKNPNSHCAYFTLGVAFADASMFRDAIKAWQKVVELAPTSPEAESATESIKLLQEYLGPQEALAPKVVPTEGIALGSGGPSTTLPGGGMNMASDSKKTTPDAPKDDKKKK